MKLVFTPTAEAQFDHQFAEGVARHGAKTAAKTFARVTQFFASTLVNFPGAGSFIPAGRFYEWYITARRSSSSIASRMTPRSCACSASFIMRKIAPASSLAISEVRGVDSQTCRTIRQDRVPGAVDVSVRGADSFVRPPAPQKSSPDGRWCARPPACPARSPIRAGSERRARRQRCWGRAGP
jgi:plasmid stabilization system protein ParE